MLGKKLNVYLIREEYLTLKKRYNICENVIMRGKMREMLEIMKADLIGYGVTEDELC